jgi:hypothetical protein
MFELLKHIVKKLCLNAEFKMYNKFRINVFHFSTQLNSTQHIFITQTGIDTSIELKSHLRKRQNK